HLHLRRACRPAAFLADQHCAAQLSWQTASELHQVVTLPLPLTLDQNAAVLAGTDEGLVVQLQGSVQGLEDVRAAVADVNPQASFWGLADALKATPPQLTLAVAVLLFCATFAPHRGGLTGHQLLMSQTQQPAVAGADGQAVVLQQASAVSFADGSQGVVHGTM